MAYLSYFEIGVVLMPPMILVSAITMEDTYLNRNAVIIVKSFPIIHEDIPAFMYLSRKISI